jgi:hypothetical protein
LEYFVLGEDILVEQCLLASSHHVVAIVVASDGVGPLRAIFPAELESHQP